MKLNDPPPIPQTKGVVVCFDSLNGVFGELCNTPVSATKETFLSETCLKKISVAHSDVTELSTTVTAGLFIFFFIIFFFLPYPVLKQAASVLCLRSCSNKPDSSRSVPRAVPLNQYLISQTGRW